MNSIIQKLLVFDDLPADEQSELEEYIRDNPEAERYLAEGRAIQQVLAAGNVSDELDAEQLADYVVSRSFAGGKKEQRFDSVERLLEERPELAEIVKGFERNLQRITDGAEDPFDQFTRLSGHTIHDNQSAGNKSQGESTPAHMRLVKQPVRWALAACIGFVALYGALRVASSQMEAEHIRVANLEDVSAVYEGPRFRSETSENDIEQLEDALQVLVDSRRSTLGLFPTYNESDLERAKGLLQSLSASEEPSFVSMEAGFVLGKLLLHQEQYSDAEAHLEQVVQLEGPRASDARRLLDYIDSQ